MADYVVVTTLSHFKLRYVIPADIFNKHFPEPVDTQAFLNFVQERDVVEFSQKHLGEVFAEAAEASQEEVLKQFDAELEYLSSWSKERKLAMINKWQQLDGI